jgi:hypothetical protein
VDSYHGSDEDQANQSEACHGPAQLIAAGWEKQLQGCAFFLRTTKRLTELEPEPSYSRSDASVVAERSSRAAGVVVVEAAMDVAARADTAKKMRVLEMTAIVERSREVEG